MAFPPRTSGAIPAPSGRTPSLSTAEAIRQRVLVRMAEKLEPARLRRMPPSFMQQEVRRTIEQLVEAEGSRLGRLEREILIEDLVRDASGYGPLEELFRDLSVSEVLVLNDQTVLCHREGRGDQGWLPTNVKFRDAEHLCQIVAKASLHAEPIGGDKLPTAAVDGRLSTGFRVIAVIPPSILNLPPYVLFQRGEPVTGTFSQSSSIGLSSASRTPLAQPAAPAATPVPKTPPVDPAIEMLGRLKTRITEHISSRLALLGVSNTSRVGVGELQKAITAYVREFCSAEKVKLSEANETKMIQEILSSLRPV